MKNAMARESSDKLGGIAEKSSVIRFPLVMRVGFPGLLVAAFLFLFARPLSSLLRVVPNQWHDLALFVGMALVLSILILALSGGVYKVFEGRALWPRRLFVWAMARQRARVRKLYSKQDALRDTDKEAYDELWSKLRAYPTDEKNEPFAARPTLLGNILREYEDYPRKRYGMDSVFYWTRIWMEMDKEKKELIDNEWSLADGFVSLSAVSFVGGAIWAALGTLHAIHPLFRAPLKDLPPTVIGLTSLTGGLLYYRWWVGFSRGNSKL